MNIKNDTITSTPPRLILSFVTGFNAVANNIQLILFPLVLDLFLWFGPHFRLQKLFLPFVNEFDNTLQATNSPDAADIIRSFHDLYLVMLEHFNLARMLRTFPIGIPSLFAQLGPLDTPLGKATIYEITSITNVMVAIIVFSILGIIGGAIYFHEVARFSNTGDKPAIINHLLWQILQAFLLTFILIVLAVIILIPVSSLLFLLAMVSASLAQIAAFAFSLFLLWLLIPLVFSPHGIFAYEQNALVSILVSARLVRFFLPGTGLFLLVIVLISQGLDVLWHVPPENSWMALVGIIGHAFISTGLLASSFIYYRGGMRWMQENLQRISVPPAEKS
jgi:hypothetical protein